METAAFVELITSVGFPIACVIALGIFVWRLYTQSVKREERLMEEITENRLVNEKAINTLTLYAERIGCIEQDVKEIKEIIRHE